MEGSQFREEDEEATRFEGWDASARDSCGRRSGVLGGDEEWVVC